jgi:F420-0:gamma-glutamyl ligase-like protein
VWHFLPRCRALLKVIRVRSGYWYPGTDVYTKIAELVKPVVQNRDFVVVSEKPILIALGSIYDEKLVPLDPVAVLITRILNSFWLALLRRFSLLTVEEVLRSTPLESLAKHKKLTLKYGSLLHFLKPVSEAGIDASNLPYHYVAIPMRNMSRVAEGVRKTLAERLGVNANVVVIDSDRMVVFKRCKSIAIAPRPAEYRRVVDLGVLSFITRLLLRGRVRLYPTIVAYAGEQYPLRLLLEVAKKADRAVMSGLGRTAIEMLRSLNRTSFDEVKWSDMNKAKHYPIAIVRILRNRSRLCNDGA